MGYTVREAFFNEAGDISALMQRVHDGMKDKSRFICDGPELVKENIRKPNIALLAERDDGHLAAALYTRIPGTEPDNLGLDISLTGDELDKVIHVESVVVDEADRGHGLEQILIGECLERLKDTGFSYVMATVHPDNVPSLKSFYRNGFDNIVVKEKYNGNIRAVLLKRINS